MPPAKRPRFPLLTADTIANMDEFRRVHVLNKRAVRHGKSLGDAVGMSDLGIHLVRIAPGDQSTEYHTHYCDEEFIYILSGSGIAEIGKRKIKIGPGDFMGFAKKSLPHGMSNPFKDDLVYLMGGTRKPIDISEYPRSKTRAYKFDGKRHSVKFKDV
ncbi:MAG: hypothetical protein JWN94_3409 [Betaproteobacteria bacterium]|nr:hypothetical protein [Betaproteobacteria bacterium]